MCPCVNSSKHTDACDKGTKPKMPLESDFGGADLYPNGTDKRSRNQQCLDQAGTLLSHQSLGRNSRPIQAKLLVMHYNKCHLSLLLV